uniref:Reverse transcriptase domain-containing protein n=1 Tax=Globodera rostochiensis TaxID=31243 RepID=A0A914H929_GLORO
MTSNTEQISQKVPRRVSLEEVEEAEEVTERLLQDEQSSEGPSKKKRKEEHPRAYAELEPKLNAWNEMRKVPKKTVQKGTENPSDIRSRLVSSKQMFTPKDPNGTNFPESSQKVELLSNLNLDESCLSEIAKIELRKIIMKHHEAFVGSDGRIDILDEVGGKAIFSSFDFMSGFFQIGIEETHIERTAFATFCGIFEFLRMPMGLCGAPCTFQKIMESLRKELGNGVLCYLDDLIIAIPKG